MIVVNLSGGLGNQMFQYATAVTLASQHNIECGFDGSYFEQKLKHVTSWEFQLSLFNTKIRKLSKSDLTSMFPLLRYNIIFRVFRKVSLRLKLSKTYFFEKSFRYDPSLSSLTPPCYLDGYFQSYKYFESNRETILRHFKPVERPNKSNLDVISKMQSCNSVAVHFRRGDYIKSSVAAATHGASSLDYYASATSLIKSKVGECHFFIFSDDIEWVKENFEFPGNATFVNHNVGENSYWDLILISKCRHCIIANSTFSWWGAWLNENVGKIVIAPEKWFSNPELNEQTVDLMPASWVRI
ncbi:alpha-1,2-fucosyltransferase [Bdellovibrio sp. HCB290]|uniref:alpha-1,2-fucosyltransferase n=1 Tax=Bdellovibrio sp. HCB290 TaxID=3394356 RepID=UPI0039B5FCC9